MLKIDDILSDDLFKKFYSYAKQVDSIEMEPFLKANWHITVEQKKVDFGFKLRINETENTQDKKHPTIDAALQKEIFLALWELHKETQPLWRMTGQSLLNKKIKIQKFRAEFQMTDKGAMFKQHRHPFSQVNGAIFIYPDQSEGTIFHEPEEKIAPWQVNTGVAFKQELHSFKNNSQEKRRFTINTFVEVE